MSDDVTPSVIGVFLVDDHEVVREGLQRMLARCTDMCIVGQAGTLEEALHALPEAAPDVVLLDMKLPGSQGLEALTALQRLHEPPRILVLTVYDDEDLVLGAVRLGARGYVLKHTSRDELAAAIRRVASGGHYFSEEVVGALVHSSRTSADEALLTEREMDVLRLLAAGFTNREIGERLFLSSDTVKTHLTNIYRKLEVEGRAHAVAIALRRGLLE